MKMGEGKERGNPDPPFLFYFTPIWGEKGKENEIENKTTKLPLTFPSYFYIKRT